MGVGFWVLEFGFWVLGFGFWVLGFGLWILGFGALGHLKTFRGPWSPGCLLEASGRVLQALEAPGGAGGLWRCGEALQAPGGLTKYYQFKKTVTKLVLHFQFK